MTLPPSKTLGDRIRELRREKGYSLRELAARSRLKSPAFIADLERGFRFPSPDVLINLAEALGVPASDLQYYDRRAPIHEIRELADKNPAWVPVLRKLINSAIAGSVSATELSDFLESPVAAKKGAQESLPLWS